MPKNHWNPEYIIPKYSSLSKEGYALIDSFILKGGKYDEVMSCYNNKEKLGMVKLVKDISGNGYGLKQCKEYCDNFEPGMMRVNKIRRLDKLDVIDMIIDKFKDEKNIRIRLLHLEKEQLMKIVEVLNFSTEYTGQS